jgi:hypothetical protein
LTTLPFHRLSSLEIDLAGYRQKVAGYSGQTGEKSDHHQNRQCGTLEKISAMVIFPGNTN